MATIFCRVAPNMCGSSVWHMLHVTLPAPRILTWPKIFGKFVNPLFHSNKDYIISVQSVHTNNVHGIHNTQHYVHISHAEFHPNRRKGKGKGKVVPVHAMKTCRSRGTVTAVLNLGARWRCVVVSRPGYFTPRTQ